MKASFDYDGTLDQQEVKDFAAELIQNGHELWIVTMRNDKRSAGNDDIYDVAEELSIPKDRVIFTNGQLKSHFFNKNEGFAFHLDDCDWQVRNIKSTKSVFYESNTGWKTACDAALE
jgi:hypothetical protein